MGGGVELVPATAKSGGPRYLIVLHGAIYHDSDTVWRNAHLCFVKFTHLSIRGIFLYFYFFVYFFGGLQCDGNFFANAAHYMIVEGYLDSNPESLLRKVQARYQLSNPSPALLISVFLRMPKIFENTLFDILISLYLFHSKLEMVYFAILPTHLIVLPPYLVT